MVWRWRNLLPEYYTNELNKYKTIKNYTDNEEEDYLVDE